MDGELYAALLQAHSIAATENDNVSLVVADAVYRGSGNMVQALAAAALSQGAVHAPIEAARELLRMGDNAADEACAAIEQGCKVPGFGNAFYPDGDPAFFPVEAIIKERYPDVAAMIDNIRGANPKLPPPNAAMWTAAVLEIMGLPIGIGPAVFIAARVRQWAEALLANEEEENQPPWEEDNAADAR